MQILFVENHATFAQQVSSQFLAEHEVTVVSSLAAARVAIEAQPYDVLLVDYDLDDGKGDELVRELRATGSEVPVVAVSSHDEGNKALRDAGATAVCSKLDFASILEILNTIGG